MYNVYLQRFLVLCLCRGVEELLKWCPQLINASKDNGFTPVHIAAFGGHTDVVALLASHVRDYMTFDLMNAVILCVCVYVCVPACLTA